MVTSTGKEKAPFKIFLAFQTNQYSNCWNGHKPSLICSLRLLSRSNSTGSTISSKRQPLLKDIQKLSHKAPPTTPAKSSSVSSLSSSQKPPLKKNCGS